MSTLSHAALGIRILDQRAVAAGQAFEGVFADIVAFTASGPMITTSLAIGVTHVILFPQIVISFEGHCL